MIGALFYKYVPVLVILLLEKTYQHLSVKPSHYLACLKKVFLTFLNFKKYTRTVKTHEINKMRIGSTRNN